MNILHIYIYIYVYIYTCIRTYIHTYNLATQYTYRHIAVTWHCQRHVNELVIGHICRCLQVAQDNYSSLPEPRRPQFPECSAPQPQAAATKCARQGTYASPESQYQECCLTCNQCETFLVTGVSHVKHLRGCSSKKSKTRLCSDCGLEKPQTRIAKISVRGQYGLFSLDSCFKNWWYLMIPQHHGLPCQNSRARFRGEIWRRTARWSFFFPRSLGQYTTSLNTYRLMKLTSDIHSEYKPSNGHKLLRRYNSGRKLDTSTPGESDVTYLASKDKKLNIVESVLAKLCRLPDFGNKLIPYRFPTPAPRHHDG